MSDPAFDDDENEKPLDPAAERLQAKLKRLVFFSSLIMVAGLIAVFSAIIYKLSTAGENAATVSGAQMAATISVGPEARVLQTQLDGSRLFVLVEEGTGRALLQFDATTGKLLGRTDFVSR